MGGLEWRVTWRRVNDGTSVGPGHDKDLVYPKGPGDVDDKENGPDEKEIYRRVEGGNGGSSETDLQWECHSRRD